MKYSKLILLLVSFAKSDDICKVDDDCSGEKRCGRPYANGLPMNDSDCIDKTWCNDW